MKATLIVKEFNYNAYMPEIAALAAEQATGEYRNWFSTAFNWDTMRYYYQRPILRGDNLAASGYAFNSSDYNKTMLENRTALEPMKFMDSNMELYVADPNYLDKIMKIQSELKAEERTGISMSNEEKQAIKDIADSYSTLKEKMNSEEFKDLLKEAGGDDLEINPWNKEVMSIDSI